MILILSLNTTLTLAFHVPQIQIAISPPSLSCYVLSGPPGGLGERTNPQTIRLTTIYSANSSPGRCIFCIRLLSDMFRTKSVFIVPVSHTSSRTVASATGNNSYAFVWKVVTCQQFLCFNMLICFV